MAKNGLIQMDRTRSLDPQAIFGIPNMAMWLVSLNRKKKGDDNHAPQLNEEVRFVDTGCG